ncbi:TetR/AcrR family transcriptional regulator [Amycolatopsis aidingensis]|uniref:TetR/AcrR family transcriptional regulator n=1 Tax=Amycolatopsis aidingensis TaxID=2842453 RepID=UPI001C0C4617|nr:TetR/AcrR family transcriptional regulator [Amycolatopsis aidingensis]
MPKPSSRDRILDAYEEILLNHGPAAVTLDAVAARAGVSKGGLLYHFGSKDALLDGLLERMSLLNDADLAKAREAEDGVVRYYLRSSVTDASMDNPWHRTTLAAVRLAGDEPKAAESLQACMRPWRELLVEHLDDPLTAELVTLIGDGLYLRASTGEDPNPLLEQLDEILLRLGAKP